MTRAHAVAPMVGADAPLQGPVSNARPSAPRVVRRALRPTTSYYLERAMLLWPRLDRARIRKVADDPIRIAEIVERRTSQPFDVILAMLTRQSPPFTANSEEAEVQFEEVAAPAVQVLGLNRDGAWPSGPPAKN